MTTQSAQQARNTKIFVINNYNNEIEETTLYDHVMESAEETTSPRGIMTKLFVEEIEGVLYKKIGADIIITEFEYNDLDEEDQEDYNYDSHGPIKWELRYWEPNGRSRVIDTYDTEEDANDEWYTRTYNYDFLPDDQRDTMYWATREKAEAELKERIANQ